MVKQGEVDPLEGKHDDKDDEKKMTKMMIRKMMIKIIQLGERQK